MNNNLFHGYNGQPLDKDNFGAANNGKPVIHREANIPIIDDTPSLKNIVNNNALVSSSLIPGLSCNLYCVPLLILVIVVTVSVLCSLCIDVFKNKKMTLNILWGVVVNIIVVIVYFSLCQKCRNDNVIVQIIVKDILPWVIYVLLIGVLFLYISNRVIKK
jgi:hypothetical protein